MVDSPENPLNLDHLSLATTPVVALRQGSPLWQGSGFFYVHNSPDGKQFVYLVTSLHVLTGYPPGANARSPASEIAFQFHVSVSDPSQVRPVRIPLYTRSGVPIWLASETRPAADIAVIPIVPQACQDLTVYGIDQSWAVAAERGPGLLEAVYAVGFPHNLHDRANALPLWQPGTIISEPAIDFDGQPYVALELPPYPGMAGAPVIAPVSYRPPAAAAEAAHPITIRRFVGVYASFQLPGDESYPEQLCTLNRPVAVARDAGNQGGYWRAELIEDLVSALDTERWGQEILPDLA